MTVRPQPSNTFERDLCDLVSERVRRAVMSVLQLTDDHKQAFIVASTAEATVAGLLAGTYAAMTDQPTGSVNPVEVAIAVLQSAKDAATEASR